VFLDVGRTGFADGDWQYILELDSIQELSIRGSETMQPLDNGNATGEELDDLEAVFVENDYPLLADGGTLELGIMLSPLYELNQDTIQALENEGLDVRYQVEQIQ
jgi:hypothetical protein